MRRRAPDRTAFGWLITGAVLLALPARVQAHLVTTGMGPVYDGIGHLLLTPEDLVPVLAMAMYAGLRGGAAGRLAMFLLPCAWFAGGLAGAAIGGAESLPVAAGSLVVLGVLVAADVRVPPSAVGLLAIVLGLAHGFSNGAVLRGGPGIPGLIGIMTVLFVVVTVTAALVVSLTPSWVRIMVRVAGSWIAATGLLMIGWAFR